VVTFSRRPSARFALARNHTDYPNEAERRYLFQLARSLGMTVAELRARMSVAEFRQWQAYDAQLAREAPKAER
jgi:hypothetical protein